MADKTVNEILKENLEPHEFDRIMHWGKIMHALNTPDDVELDWVDVIAAKGFRDGMLIGGNLSCKLNDLKFRYSSDKRNKIELDKDGEFEQMEKNLNIIYDLVGKVGAMELKKWKDHYYKTHGYYGHWK